jgi:hypothetical protein
LTGRGSVDDEAANSNKQHIFSCCDSKSRSTGKGSTLELGGRSKGKRNRKRV